MAGANMSWSSTNNWPPGAVGGGLVLMEITVTGHGCDERAGRQISWHTCSAARPGKDDPLSKRPNGHEHEYNEVISIMMVERVIN